MRLVNLDDDNPPQVNGTPVVQSRLLQPGDLIVLSPRTRLRLHPAGPLTGDATRPWD